MKANLKHLIACAALSAIGLSPALAATGDDKAAASSDEKPAAESSQQNKMKYCNVEAGKKELRGEERRSFMSDCLRKK